MYEGLHIIYLYGCRNGLAGIMAEGGQTDMYTLTYIYGYLPIRRSTSYPEYTYRAYHLYGLVYKLICMDIQIG